MIKVLVIFRRDKLMHLLIKVPRHFK